MPLDRVEITVPARLHLGFLDLHGGLGRTYGSLGLTLDAPQTRLSLTRSDDGGGPGGGPGDGPGDGLTATGPDSERALQHLRYLREHFQIGGGFHLAISEAVPAHAGLGSGTQLALAVGMAMARMSGLSLASPAIASALGRGARSGIGIGAFEQGGLLLDGGRSETSLVPPIVARLPIPEAWRFLLVFDPARQGLHGGDESAAFERLPAFPAEQAAGLCRLVLMALLPAAAEADAARFGAAVTELQAAVGDHFAAAQGARFASPAVAEALAWLQSEGASGVGQSSWGPTGFAVLPSDFDGQRLLAAAERRWPEGDAAGLTFVLCRGRNHGADISELADEHGVLAKSI